MEALLRWRLAWLWALLFLFAWLCTAWVSEDAFITFRAVDQLLAGHGPVWNLGERVQVYTHPLWYGLLVLTTGLGLPSYWGALLLNEGKCVVRVVYGDDGYDTDVRNLLQHFVHVCSPFSL